MDKNCEICRAISSVRKQYQFHSKNPAQQKIHYNILTYQTEAYCELNRIEKAYEKLQDTIGVVDYT